MVNNKPRPFYKRVRQSHPVGGDQLTEQSHEKACNINSIMAKYLKTGLIEHINTNSPQYGDVTGADFKAAQDLVAAQRTVFEELPAQVRKELNNDPAVYLDMVMSEEGREELRNILNPAPEVPEEAPVAAPEQVNSEQTAVT